MKPEAKFPWVLAALIVTASASSGTYIGYQSDTAVDATRSQKTIPAIPKAERNKLLNDSFSEFRDTSSIPPKVKNMFAAMTSERNFEMANPGEEFQVSDYVKKHGLPWRRLIFAGSSRKKFFLHYERGGRGHSFYLVVFDMQHDGQPIWAGAGFNGYKTVDALRIALVSDRFEDDREYTRF